MSETTEATQVLEGIKSLTVEEPPALDVQAIANAATRKVVDALSAQPHAELGLPEADADADATTVMEKPAPVEVVPPLKVQRGDGAVLISAPVVSLLKASLKANLQDVANKILWAMLED